MKSVSPNIYVNDLPATIRFYQQFGFKVELTVPETGDLAFSLMVCGQVTFMFQTFASIDGRLPQVSRANGGSLLLYIKINDIRSFFDKIKGNVIVLGGLEKTFYGATEFSVLDNNNYVLTFSEDE